MPKFLKERTVEVHVEYYHYYESDVCPGAGYSFPCTKTGALLPLQPAGLESLKLVQGNPHYIDRGIIQEEWDYISPAVIECGYCGRQVELNDPLANDCICGFWYSGTGQHINPPSMWEEVWDADDPSAPNPYLDIERMHRDENEYPDP